MRRYFSILAWRIRYFVFRNTILRFKKWRRVVIGDTDYIRVGDSLYTEDGILVAYNGAYAMQRHDQWRCEECDEILPTDGMWEEIYLEWRRSNKATSWYFCCGDCGKHYTEESTS